MPILDAVTARKIASLRRALAQTEAAWGSCHKKLLVPILNLADLYFALCDYRQAEQLYDRYLSISCKNFGYGHSKTALGLRQVGEIYQVQGLIEDSERMYLWSLSVALTDSKNDETILTLKRLLGLYREQNQEFKARIIESRLRVQLTAHKVA